MRYRALAAILLGASMMYPIRTVMMIRAEYVEPFDTSSSHQKSSHHPTMAAARAIDPEEYHVFDNACLEPGELYHWTIRVNEIASDRWRRQVTLRVFYGASDFVNHKFRVVQDQRLTSTEPFSQRRNGTFMLQANTHAYNNFHIISDFVLPAFRARRKAGVTGLLIPEGCAHCWSIRLPLQTMLLDMMHLTVVYPLENALSKDAPMCFDRLIIQRFKQEPYYARKGRFSRFWPRAIFADFRDSARDYFRRVVKDEEVERDAAENDTDVNEDSGSQNSTGQEVLRVLGSSSDVARPSNRSKPVLSWMTRSVRESCTGRCITNEKEAVAQLSKYFHVNLLDFSAGLTTEQAMAYIMNTDVLIGLHGAGLAYIAFLPDGAMVVELRSIHGNRFFMNMASSVNVPYYSMSLSGCIGPGENDVYTLPKSTVLDMTEQIYSAYHHESLLFTQGQSESSGNCQFPRPIEPCGHLSSTEFSRCYLRQLWWRPGWWQCPKHEWWCI